VTNALVFPQVEDVPVLKTVTKTGKEILLRQTPLVWTQEWVEQKFYPAYRDVEWELPEHARTIDEPLFLGGSIVDSIDKAISGHLERSRREWAEEQKRISFLITDKDGEILGGRSVTDINLETGLGVLGWAVVRKQYRGEGIMPAATEVLIEWLREYGFRELEAHIHQDNLASQRHISKVGFVRDGRKPGSQRAQAHFIWRLKLAA
jgi:RimJ/RimL family protein N-acetyltransferase